MERLSPVPIKTKRQASVRKQFYLYPTPFYTACHAVAPRRPPPSLPRNLPALTSESLTFYISFLTTTSQKIALQREIASFRVERRSKRLYRSGFCTLYLLLLGYLKDSNAAAHSVDSDIFYAVIYLFARSKTCNNIYFSK